MSVFDPPDPSAALLETIRRVRSRWRLRRALTGLALAFAASVAILGISAWAMDALRYEIWVVRTFQVSAWLLAAGALIRFLWSPLRSRVSDRQVALYVEEHDSSLQETVVSGVELGPGLDSGKTGEAGVSPELSRMVVEEAIRRCEEGNIGTSVESASLRGAASAFGSALAAIVGLALLAPPALQGGMSLLFTPWRDIDDANPYRIHVQPGDAVIATGSDRWIDARLEGFTAERVVLVTQDAAARRTRQTWPMLPDPETEGFRHLLLGVSVATDYFVEADGVRSPTWRIEVEDYPQVSRLDLTYRYPAHTGLSPRLAEDGGDIAAVAGTDVDVLVRASLPVDSGAIRVETAGNEAREVPLLPAEDAGEGLLKATLRLDQSGSYRIALADDRGRVRTASRDYAIEVLDDLPPIVRFVNPGRDIEASAVEEVFTEARAEDDYAIRSLELRWSVNGGPETVEALAGAGMRREIQTGHTLFLEEHDLVPGDLLAYYAVARDGAGATASTDLYFVAIRRLDQRYRQADSMPGGGGGQDGDALDGTLTLRQKQVVVATFKAIQERPQLPGTVFSETVATVGLAQGRLREQVGALARRLRNRGIADAPGFQGIVEELEAALGEMATAEERLIAGEPEAALPSEQKALAHLQRADSTFAERQVGFGGGGGGGGGAPSPQSEDLARLFELEMDKLRNQYETVEQRQRRSADDEVDEVMERLAELARRQEQENARRGMATPPNAPGGAGGASQRRIAEETEEVARRLERLARERSRPDLAAVSRRLRDAAQRMRSADAGSDGVSSGLSAAEQLRGARRDLDSQRRERLGRDMDQLADEARRLRSAQNRIRDEVSGLGETPDPETVAGLQQRKEDLAGRVQDVEQELDRVSREWRRDEPEAAEAAGEAARGIRDRKLKEKIHYSRGVIAERTPEYADQFEAMIAQDLESLEADLARAGEAARGSERAVREDTLDRAGALVRGLEALRNRLAEPTGEGEGQQPSDGAGRQLGRELERRLAEAEGLRQALGREGNGGPLGPERLDGALQALRGLSPGDLLGDPRAVERLESEVLDALREFEFDLRRLVSGETETDAIATGAERAPEGYEEMVEAYFRALGRAEPEPRPE